MVEAPSPVSARRTTAVPRPQPSTEPSKIMVPPPANFVAGSPDTTAPAITADPDHLPVAVNVVEYGTTQRRWASQAPLPSETGGPARTKAGFRWSDDLMTHQAVHAV
jgi:hypothetical protein